MPDPGGLPLNRALIRPAAFGRGPGPDLLGSHLSACETWMHKPCDEATACDDDASICDAAFHACSAIPCITNACAETSPS